MNSEQIRIRVAEIDSRLIALLGEAEQHSLDAVSGDADAQASLDRVQQERDALTREHATLEMAKAAAVRNEDAEFQAALTAQRTTKLAEAKEFARKIGELSAEIDRDYYSFLYNHAELQKLEAALRRTLVPLGISHEGRTGQGQIAGLAVDRYSTVGGPAFEIRRAMADIFESAWSHIANLELDDLPAGDA